MKLSPEVANEIARLMRDPNSMRAEVEQMRRAARGRGHYDPINRVCQPVTQEAGSGRREDIAADNQAAMRALRWLRSTGRSSLNLVREVPMRRPYRLTESWVS